MPGQGNPIIVGGGINAAAPVAIGEFLFLTSASPPAASSTPRLRLSGASLIMESAAAKGDTVIGPGSTQTGAQGALSILIGSTVTANTGSSGAGFASIGIGSNIVFGAGTNNLVIGEQTIGLNFAGGSNVHLGRLTSLGGSFRNSLVTVGQGISATSSNSVLIGSAITSTGNNNVIVGDAATSSVGDNVIIGVGAGAAGVRTTIIGRASTGTGTTTDLVAIGGSIIVANLPNFIAIGQGVSPAGLASGDIVVGNNGLGGGGFSSRVVWGGANLHTSGVAVPAFTHRYKNAQGANIAAGAATWIAPLSTGTGAPAGFLFQTSDAAGAGSGLQVPLTRVTIAGAGGLVTIAAATVTGPTLTVGGFGGAGVPSVRLDNLTNGAGAGAGTLTNAPTAGDPTFWIPINIAGTVLFVPAWP